MSLCSVLMHILKQTHTKLHTQTHRHTDIYAGYNILFLMIFRGIWNTYGCYCLNGLWLSLQYYFFSEKTVTVKEQYG